VNRRRTLRGFCRHDGGGAAVEMALVSTFLCTGIMNAAELARYGYNQMQLSSASEAGASAALAACDTAHLPATANCPGLASAVNTAIQSTGLGAQVTLQGAFTEGYYCLNLNHQLQYVQGPANKPADCSSVANPSGKPALYLSLTISYPYTAMFGPSTAVAALPQTMTRTSWMRMA